MFVERITAVRSCSSYLRLAKIIAIVAVTSLTLPAVAADDLQYDVQDQRNAATFKELIWNTRSCMNQSLRVLLMQGERDSTTITAWAQETCGGALLNFMTSTLHRPDADAAAFLRAMAYNELNRIPGIARSNTPPAMSEQIERGTPPKEVALLIAKEEQLNDKCRGGSGDDPATMTACGERDVIVRQIRAKNWCWGKDGQAEFEKKWQKCASSQR